jgi:hypothetical protein
MSLGVGHQPMYTPGRKKDGQCAKHCRSPACRDMRALAIRVRGVNDRQTTALLRYCIAGRFA